MKLGSRRLVGVSIWKRLPKLTSKLSLEDREEPIKRDEAKESRSIWGTVNGLIRLEHRTRGGEY